MITYTTKYITNSNLTKQGDTSQHSVHSLFRLNTLSRERMRQPKYFNVLYKLNLLGLSGVKNIADDVVYGKTGDEYHTTREISTKAFLIEVYF